jgi:hypothetical protein
LGNLHKLIPPGTSIFTGGYTLGAEVLAEIAGLASGWADEGVCPYAGRPVKLWSQFDGNNYGPSDFDYRGVGEPIDFGHHA